MQLDWPIALLAIDLDHFKRVNDTFNHQVGDAVLVETARLMRDAAGPLDHVARLGGEEFAVAAVGVDERQARDLADRLVRMFRVHDWDRVQPGLERITISVGVAVRAASRGLSRYIDLDALIAEADQALLRVKRNGRDGFLLAGEALRPGPVTSSTILARIVPDAPPAGRGRFIRRR